MSQFDDDVEKTTVLGQQDFELLRQQIDRSAYLIVISGRSVGRMYKLDENKTTLGRSPDSGVLIEDEGVSRNHAMVERRNDEYFLIDNQSTNGVFVNGDRINMHRLEDGDKLQIGSNTILKFSFQDEVEENYQRKLIDAATKDALTGTFNKRYFVDHLKTEFAFSYRHGTQLSLLLFDIDHFKKLNDGWGHLAGDMVLKNLAGVVHKQLRTEDIFARYGGEEFGLILRETDSERAFLIAERVRRALESHEFIYEGERLPVTISVGVATLKDKNFKSPKDLVRTADQFLYKAKEGGRNRTESDLMA